MTAPTPQQLDLDVLAQAMIGARGYWDRDDMIETVAVTARTLSHRGVQITLDGAGIAPERMDFRGLCKLIEQRTP